MSVPPHKKMKDVQALQKELEFYTNLLAQHEREKLKAKKPTALHCSSPNASKRNNTQSRYITKVIKSSPLLNNYKVNNHLKKRLATNPASFITKKETLPKASYFELFYKRKVGTSSNYTFYKNVPNNEKVLLSKSSSSFKIEPHEDNKISLVNSTKPTDSTCSNINIAHKKNTTKQDSQKLMGEIMAITQQLKLKSNTLRPSDKTSNASRIVKNVDGKTVEESTKCVSFSTKKNKNSKSAKCFKSDMVFEKDHNQKLINSLSKLSTTQIKYDKSIQYLKSQSKVIEKYRYVTPKKSLKSKSEFPSESLNQKSKCKIKKIYSFENLSPNASVSKENSLNSLSKQASFSTVKNLKTKVDLVSLRLKVASKKCQLSQSTKVHLNAMKKFSPQIHQGRKNLKRNLPTLKNTSISNKSNTEPYHPNLLNSKYKVINGVQPLLKLNRLLEDGTKRGKRCNNTLRSKQPNISTYKLVNNNKVPFITTPRNSRNLISYRKKSFSRTPSKRTFYPNQKLINLTSKEHLRNEYRKLLSKNLPLNTSEVPGDVDVDLLLELAAENKKSIYVDPVRCRNAYKTKNKFINNHSIQSKTARMIKSKYFNSSKRQTSWRNHLDSSTHFKGFPRNDVFKQLPQSSAKNRKCVSPKQFLNKKLNSHKKKIIERDGEKFIIGSTGKSLQKLTRQSPNYGRKTKRLHIYTKSPFKTSSSMKTSTPVSKVLASRVLNRSINQMLTASARKKMNKVNKYCMFYNRFGRCNKGVKCSYIHDPSKIAVCTRFLRGTCRKEKCLFSHEINPGKMALCSFFLQDACSNDNCPYRHEKLSPDAKLCIAFVQGYCPDGKECKNAHVLMCPQYIQGICDKGKDCVFSHPPTKEKKVISKQPANVEEINDNFMDTINRYFQSNFQESSLTEERNLVFPRVKTLSEQPSFISLT